MDDTSSPIVEKGYRFASETPARIASRAAGPGPEPFSLLPIRTSPALWTAAAGAAPGATFAARLGPHAPAPAATALPPTSLRKSRRDDTAHLPTGTRTMQAWSNRQPSGPVRQRAGWRSSTKCACSPGASHGVDARDAELNARRLVSRRSRPASSTGRCRRRTAGRSRGDRYRGTRPGTGPGTAAFRKSGSTAHRRR